MKTPRRALHGVLLVDKPVGPTSQTVLSQARRLWRAEKGGHTGTLDPLASGLLPLCFGAATKFAQVCLDADKRYLATVHLGQTRAGGDLEGEVLVERPVNLTRADIEALLPRFTGAIEQTPPMHSALKVDGKPLYELARAGVTVERAARAVTIHAIKVMSFDAPTLVIDVQCSKGTYIRTLAEDLGEALGCGAHLAGLRRTATGGFDLADAIKLDEAEHWSESQRDAALLDVDALVTDWPSIDLEASEAARFLTGLRRRVTAPDADKLRVYGPHPDASSAARRIFLGAAHLKAGELIPDRLLSPHEIQTMADAMTENHSST